MSSSQKIIKYLAIAFGIFLSINIICAIVFGLTAVARVLIGLDFKQEDDFSKNDEFIRLDEDLSNVNSLDIDLSMYNLEVKEGNNFNVEIKGNLDDELSCTKRDNTLVIKDKDNINIGFNFNNDVTNTVILYIPAQYEFDNVIIKNGIGKCDIENIISNQLYIELGVGNTKIGNIVAKDSELKGGVGKVEIENFEFYDLKLETGVGKFDLSGKVLNKGNINCGVGKVDLDLLGSVEDYSIKTNIGVGKMKLNDTTCSNDSTYGNGNIKLNINGGVGAVDIDTEHDINM